MIARHLSSLIFTPIFATIATSIFTLTTLFFVPVFAETTQHENSESSKVDFATDTHKDDDKSSHGKKVFIAAFEQFLTTELAIDTPGYALALVHQGKPILVKGYGLRKNGESEQINADTAFRLASISKTFASSAAGLLVQKDQLQWDSPIYPYINQVPFSNNSYAQTLTLRHILSHTSGLMPHAYSNKIEDRLSYQRILQRMDKVPFVCPPGKCYGYQNIAYSLSGDIIQSINKTSYEDFVEKSLFTPLNMHSASFGRKAFISQKNHATPHSWSKKQQSWRPMRVRGNYYKVPPAAGVNASIRDMSHWLLAHLGHYPTVLHADTLNALHSKQIKTTKKQAHYRGDDWKPLKSSYYALGWRGFDYANQKGFVQHGGWVQGFRCEMVFHPELQMGMVILVNAETRAASLVVPKFVNLYLEHFKPQASDSSL
ncbi:MAG: serine hydrolase [Alteromonadaceae bacterium]|nr:MAG: serine hydrolase [Alteromonadaceae bacterium]